MTDAGLAGLLRDALATGDDGELRAALQAGSGLPGPRLNLRLVASFADAVAAVVLDPAAAGLVDALEARLDGWAALSPGVAPGDQPPVILPCAAVAAYGAVGAVRPDWWGDETAKLRRAASDERWRVREVVAQALARLLRADWDRTMELLRSWVGDPDPLVVRAAVAAVADPPLLRGDGDRAAAAHAVQEAAVTALRSWPPAVRRSEAGRVLRQALGVTISVTTAATGDIGLLRSLAAVGRSRRALDRAGKPTQGPPAPVRRRARLGRGGPVGPRPAPSAAATQVSRPSHARSAS